MVTGHGVEHLGDWQAVAAEFSRLARSDDYLAWLLDAEGRGDFEKRASPDEIAAAQRQMDARVRTVIAAIGEQALDDKAYDGAFRALDLLRAGGPGDAAAACLLDRMEDALNAQCIEREEDIRAALKDLFDAQALVVEPSSAITLAFVRARAADLEDPICVILTGENIAREDHRRLIAAPNTHPR